jgi:hypothetical protein
MSNVVQYRGNQGTNDANTTRGFSPFIWADCPWDAIARGSIDGIQDFDDFLRGQLTPTITTTIDVNNYLMFGSSGATVTYDDAQGGAIVLAETTDNESVNITTEQHPYRLTQGGGDFWFEARIKLALTATTENSWAVGLMDTTATTATVPLTAAGAIADVNFVGFHKPEANTTAYDTSYKADGVTLVEVNSDVGAIANATYFKVGMKYKNSDNKLRFFINGVQCANTKTLPNATGTDFPADIGLGFVLALGVGAAASDNTLSCDWWRACQRIG